MNKYFICKCGKKILEKNKEKHLQSLIHQKANICRKTVILSFS